MGSTPEPDYEGRGERRQAARRLLISVSAIVLLGYVLIFVVGLAGWLVVRLLLGTAAILLFLHYRAPMAAYLGAFRRA